MLMRHGLGMVSAESAARLPNDAAKAPEAMAEAARSSRAELQPAASSEPAAAGALSQELEALLDLVRQAPQASPPTPLGQPVASTDAAQHELLLQALLAKTLAASTAAEMQAYREGSDARGRRDEPRMIAPPETSLATRDARLPATWYSPSVPAPEPWFGSELRAGALGLGLGILIIVPVVLWSSGWLLSERSAMRGAAVKTLKAVEPTAPLPAPMMASLAEPKVELATVRREPIVAAGPITPVADAAHPQVAQARLSIESGDIVAARAMLSDAGLAGRGDAQFALAETFDPNVLAAWGTRGVAADVEKARAHYQVALGLGFATARERLKGLQ